MQMQPCTVVSSSTEGAMLGHHKLVLIIVHVPLANKNQNCLPISCNFKSKESNFMQCNLKEALQSACVWLRDNSIRMDYATALNSELPVRMYCCKTSFTWCTHSNCKGGGKKVETPLFNQLGWGCISVHTLLMWQRSEWTSHIQLVLKRKSAHTCHQFKDRPINPNEAQMF